MFLMSTKAVFLGQILFFLSCNYYSSLLFMKKYFTYLHVVFCASQWADHNFFCFADRYVLLGNHHDAWVFGAVDPLSGSAALTEITRVFGLMLSKGTMSDGRS